MQDQLNRQWTYAAIAVALALGVGAGRFLSSASAPPAEPPVAAATKPQAAPVVTPTAKPEEPGITRYQVPVTVSQPAKGPADALVTVVEWCDFQSKACRDAEPVLSQVLAAYEGKLRFVFRHFPPAQSLEAQLAHEFAQIAHEQNDKFWPVRERLMQEKGPITLQTVQAIAKDLELDWDRVRTALEGHAFAQHIGSDALFAKFFEVTEAPAIFVNGRRLAGPPSLDAFRTLIDDELKRADALVQSGIPREGVYANLIRGGKWTRPAEMDAPAN